MTQLPTFEVAFTCRPCLFFGNFGVSYFVTIIRTFRNLEKLLFEKSPSPLKEVALLVRLLRTQVRQEKLGGTMAATVIHEARKKSRLSRVILLVIQLVQLQDVMILISDYAPSETIA